MAHIGRKARHNRRPTLVNAARAHVPDRPSVPSPAARAMNQQRSASNKRCSLSKRRGTLDGPNADPCCPSPRRRETSGTAWRKINRDLQASVLLSIVFHCFDVVPGLRGYCSCCWAHSCGKALFIGLTVLKASRGRPLEHCFRIVFSLLFTMDDLILLRRSVVALQPSFSRCRLA